MSKEELVNLEKTFKDAGYQMFTEALSSREDRGWFKTFYSEERDEYGDKVMLYMIEFRIWDFTKYGSIDHPYSCDTLILDGDSSYRIDLQITSPEFDVETTEQIAKDLHLMLSKYTHSKIK